MNAEYEPAAEGEPAAAAPEGSAAPARGEAAARRTRHAWLLAFAAFSLGVSAVLLLIAQRWRPIGEVRGRVIGAVQRVSLADVPRHVFRDGVLHPDGSYVVPLPPFARQPRVILEAEGGAAVASKELEPHPGLNEAPVYALWTSPIDVTIDGGQVRFNWAPIPEGEGFPVRRRYSLLLRYFKQNGDEAEVSFLAITPGRTIELAEVQDLLQEWDTSKNTVSLQLRAYDPGEKDGAQWTAGQRDWVLPVPQKR
ncbi:MAG: hypothetical protein AB7N76_30020 [Planctomycetota bacterium]